MSTTPRTGWTAPGSSANPKQVGMGVENGWPLRLLFGETNNQIAEFIQPAVDGGIVKPLGLAFVMRAVDEDSEVPVVVEEVGASLGAGDGVLTTVGLTVAVLVHMVQPGLFERAARSAPELGVMLV